MAKIVNSIFVYNDKILAIVLHGDFAVVLGENKTAPSEVKSAVQSYLVEANVISVEISSQFGDDGVRYLLCIKYISFHHSRFGGKNLQQSRAQNLIIRHLRAENPLGFILASRLLLL